MHAARLTAKYITIEIGTSCKTNLIEVWSPFNFQCNVIMTGDSLTVWYCTSICTTSDICMLAVICVWRCRTTSACVWRCRTTSAPFGFEPLMFQVLLGVKFLDWCPIFYMMCEAVVVPLAWDCPKSTSVAFFLKVWCTRKQMFLMFNALYLGFSNSGSEGGVAVNICKCRIA